MESIVTPLNVSKFKEILEETKYNPDETKFLIDGFTTGFDIGYHGTTVRQCYSDNIPITVGSTQELWSKIMKEVRAGRYAGPYKSVPFSNFIQSPIGLVPKAGNKTQLIFHLSFEFFDEKGNSLGSVNSCMPREWCSVRYNDLDTAAAAWIKIFNFAKEKGVLPTAVFLGKTDLSSAFRVLPLKKGCYCWLVMKAMDPQDNVMKYFVEKCLPFSASISCSHYQRFSNALHHIIRSKYCVAPGKDLTNYLDDFLFLAYT